MPTLENPKHEAFAKHLAQGETASQAYKAAGYQPCRQNASPLMTHDDIKARVAEIKESPIAQVTTPPDVSGRSDVTGQFLKGFSRGGRPKGNRNRLGEAFLMDLREEWERTGAKALKQVAETNPEAFVKITASILPKELNATLDVDVDLFASCRNFAAAFRLARDHIGADTPLLIEGNSVGGE